MDIRIGDIVRFISEKLEGKVTGMVDSTTVNVYCDEYGFEIPANINDLVVIKSDFDSATPSSVKESTQKAVVIDSTDEVYMAVVPDNFRNLPDSRYEIYLVNDTAQTCLYTAGIYDGEKHMAISAGNCNPEATWLLGTYSMKELDRIKAFHIQVIFYQKGNYTPRKAMDVQLKISPATLCKSGVYQHVKWFDRMTLLKPLDRDLTLKAPDEKEQLLQLARKEKEEEKPVSRPQKQIVNNIVEIDLHIDRLLETTAGMENKDILDYQLDVFHKTLEEYKLRTGQKIVFIHGKGDGVLRQRILWELQTKYKRFRHQDASFKQYGYGATMVTIK